MGGSVIGRRERRKGGIARRGRGRGKNKKIDQRKEISRRALVKREQSPEKMMEREAKREKYKDKRQLEQLEEERAVRSAATQHLAP